MYFIFMCHKGQIWVKKYPDTIFRGQQHDLYGLGKDAYETGQCFCFLPPSPIMVGPGEYEEAITHYERSLIQ